MYLNKFEFLEIKNRLTTRDIEFLREPVLIEIEYIPSSSFDGKASINNILDKINQKNVSDLAKLIKLIEIFTNLVAEPYKITTKYDAKKVSFEKEKRYSLKLELVNDKIVYKEKIGFREILFENRINIGWLLHYSLFKIFGFRKLVSYDSLKKTNQHFWKHIETYFMNITAKYINNRRLILLNTIIQKNEFIIQETLNYCKIIQLKKYKYKSPYESNISKVQVETLKLKVSSLRISEQAKDKLFQCGIDQLEDFNTFSIKEIKLLLAETFEEIASVLRSYSLPRPLENMNVSNETFDRLRANNIKDLVDVLEFDRHKLYQIFEDDSTLKEEIKSVLKFYINDQF